MDAAVTISPQPPENHGLDYAYLRTEGIRITQKLSSAIWTDYNEHDPGVTTLEQLCYALTELSYRAELPLEDLLADRRTGRIHARNHGLYSARQILPCNPVTVADYRKLIVDSVAGVANVWLTPRGPETHPRHLSGLYDICVYDPDVHEHHDPDCGQDEEERSVRRVLRRVRAVYSRHRNLCEDVGRVRMLRPAAVRVFADVSIGAGESAERILSDIFFSLGNLLAPELRRRPLSELIRAGSAPQSIFNGPLLRNGFIDDSELQPRAAAVAVNELIRAISQTTSVEATCNVEARTSDGIYGPNASIPVPARRFLRIDTRPRHDGGGFTIRLLRNGVVCSPNQDEVARYLRLRQANYRRTYPLEEQYEEFFGMPRGQARDVARYYSIQNQYPGVYGISSYGLPSDASTARFAQAKQLKGYLLAFEQLMANYFSQLAHVGDLFSIKPESWKTYYWQSLAKSVPNVEPLLMPDYEAALEKIVSGEDDTLARRNRFASFLLTLYANNLQAPSESSGCRRDLHSTERLLHARLEFLRVLAPSTRFRGRAIDYRAEPSFRNVAGMELKCRIEMGLDVERHRPLRDVLISLELKFESKLNEQVFVHDDSHHAGHIEEHFRPVASYPEPDEIPASSTLLSGMLVSEEFLAMAHKPANLYVGRLPGDEEIAIVYRSKSRHGWILIDVRPELKSALGEVHALCRQLAEVHRSRTQLYIVEHNLLRFGQRRRRGADIADTEFPYSFTLTAVVGLPAEERRNRNNKRTVEEIIRENTPSHIVAEVCFLPPCRLLKFEHLYWVWRLAMQGRERFAIELTSARLRRFLERQRRTTAMVRE